MLGWGGVGRKTSKIRKIHGDRYSNEFEARPVARPKNRMRQEHGERKPIWGSGAMPSVGSS